MGLVNLLADVGTEYRKLKFGNDRPGGGNSKQPFIQKDLPSLEQQPVSPYPDFLFRDPKNQLNGRKDDLERITKFLISREGGLFIAKQELLSLQNPLTQGRPNRSTPISGLYNPLLTLAQVAGAGTGLHIEKQGLLPIFNNETKYSNIYKTFYNDEFSNRLTLLYNSKISPSEFDQELAKLFGKGLGIASNERYILSYMGGPDSPGLGRTRIPFAGDRLTPIELKRKTEESLVESFNKTTSPLNNEALIEVTSKGLSRKSGDLGYYSLITGIGEDTNDTRFLINGNSVYTVGIGSTFPKENTKNTIEQGVYTFNQLQLSRYPTIGKKGSTDLSSIADFRAVVSSSYKTPETLGIYSFNYSSSLVNIEQRVGLGNPGKRSRNRAKLNSYEDATVDRINMIPLYKDRIVLDPKVLTRDLIKFRFEIIDNQDPGAQTFVHFRAYLGAITDNYSADWDSFRYVGRGDKFYNYQGFERNINFSFQVSVQSRAEMRSVYQKLNYLASSLAPDYEKGYMKGNLIRLTIGDHFYSLPGFIDNLTYTIPENASWEIAFDSPEGGVTTGLMETSKYFEVQVSFKAIHDFIPRLNNGGGRDAAFITNPTAIGDANQYLDNNKVYFFNNRAPGSTDITNFYGKNPGEFIRQNNISYIDPNNLQQYASREETIKVQENNTPQQPVTPPLPASGPALILQ